MKGGGINGRKKEKKEGKKKGKKKEREEDIFSKKRIYREDGV